MERLKSFFAREDSHYRVKSELRDCITFATHNLLKDAPFTKLDILYCRNFLIYLRPETQQGLIPLFHCALKPQGLLLLDLVEQEARREPGTIIRAAASPPDEYGIASIQRRIKIRQ